MAKKKAAKRAPGRSQTKGRTPGSKETANPVVDEGSDLDARKQALKEGIELAPLTSQAIENGINEAVTRQLKPVFEKLAAVQQAIGTPTNAGQGVASLSDVLLALTQGMNDLHAKFGAVPKASETKITGEITTNALTKATTEERRRTLWGTERREKEPQQSKDHLPRPSIVGRAMHELQTTTKVPTSIKPEMVLRCVQKNGPHHLSTIVLGLLSRYKPEGAKVDADVSGKLGKQLTPREAPLILLHLVAAENGKRWLTPIGLATFDGWPDWEVRDDDFECCGRKDRASMPSAAPSAPTELA